MKIYTLRTTIGREKIVIDEIDNKVKLENLNIKALLHPERLKGYVMIEGEEGDIREAIRDIRYAKGLIGKEVTIDKIKQFLESKVKKIELHKGDIIEIIGGPFKGERGKITRVDKNEVTAELLEAAVSIPITLTNDSIRLLEKFEETKKEGGEKDVRE
ncbi:MAG: transcription elongation factor Spt5 [Candidatus Aenigmarchaeota archaeon]|nr:transcription elongation factor Spt5 [Candidatus Aenigmarchaeota archaeon]